MESHLEGEGRQAIGTSISQEESGSIKSLSTLEPPYLGINAAPNSPDCPAGPDANQPLQVGSLDILHGSYMRTTRYIPPCVSIRHPPWGNSGT